MTQSGHFFTVEGSLLALSFSSAGWLKVEDKREQGVRLASAAPCCGGGSRLFYHMWLFNLLRSGIGVREPGATLCALMSPGDCFADILRVLCVLQPMGSHERGREKRRWGRTCDGWREVVFFPTVEEKQFVVPSPSRKHQPLFPLNQHCENGVSVWVNARERDGTVVGRHLQLRSPVPSAPPPLASPRGHTELTALPLHPDPLHTLSLSGRPLFSSSPQNYP